jgi:signal transduction histidine kinase
MTPFLIVPGGSEIRLTPAYYLTFFPYAIFYIFTAHYVVLKRINKCAALEKRILRFHLAGFAVLILAGLLDLGTLMGFIPPLITSFTILGVLAFGIMASLIFAERFMIILRDRQATFEKLETAYRDLEQVNALKQLGESTAIINHEIKNYMFMISGNAQLLEQMENLSNKGHEIVRNIVSSVERLTGFSDDILKLSRTQILKEMHPINVTELVSGLIDKHFADRKSRFVLNGLDKEHFIYGDWGKLEQVFVNIFNNSLEAGGADPVGIRVKMTSERGFLLVSVEDNGVGCDTEQLEGLFKAFYTTKKATGGTGLGMSISRTIVEAHGGKISAYSKNLARKGDHGLKLIMTFPLYAQNMMEEEGRKHPIVLIKDGMDNLQDVIRVFQNVKVNPYVLQGIQELNDTEFPPDMMTVLVTPKTMAGGFKKLAGYPWLCMVSHHERNLYILDHSRGNRPEVFSEEYVIGRLLRKSNHRTRLRERQHHLV